MITELTIWWNDSLILPFLVTRHGYSVKLGQSSFQGSFYFLTICKLFISFYKKVNADQAQPFLLSSAWNRQYQSIASDFSSHISCIYAISVAKLNLQNLTKFWKKFVNTSNYVLQRLFVVFFLLQTSGRLKYLLMEYPWSSFSSLFFFEVKILISVIDILVVTRISFLWFKLEHFFFTNGLSKLLTKLRVCLLTQCRD